MLVRRQALQPLLAESLARYFPRTTAYQREQGRRAARGPRQAPGGQGAGEEGRGLRL
jgi:hypothetical protein